MASFPVTSAVEWSFKGATLTNQLEWATKALGGERG